MVSFAQVQGAMVAESATAAAFARVDGRFGGRLTITAPYGAWRSWDDQNYLYVNQHKPGFSSAWSPNDPRANHMKGLSLDINNWASFPTLQSEMARDGFVRNIVGENWHYEHLYPQVSTAGLGSIPIGNGTENAVSDVYAIEMTSQGQPNYQQIALFGDVRGGWIEIGVADRAGFFNPWRQGEATARGLANATDIPLKGVSIAEWNALRSVHLIPAEAGAKADSKVDEIVELLTAASKVVWPDGGAASTQEAFTEILANGRGTAAAVAEILARPTGGGGAAGPVSDHDAAKIAEFVVTEFKKPGN